MTATPLDQDRKRRLVAGFRGRTLQQAAADPALRADMEVEAESDPASRLVDREFLKIADAARGVRSEGLGLLSTADVVLVPGFLASQLEDVAGDKGLIWIDPRLALDTDQLLDLKLAATNDDDDPRAADPAVSVRPRGAIPILYAGLRAALEFSRYHVIEFGFDWRKHVDASAGVLMDLIRNRATDRPLHLVAHSQGSLVARRALQLLGPEQGRRLVNSLVLLGPATAGSFSAAFGIAGTHEMLDTVRRFGVTPPDGFDKVLQSLSGIYQLLPWRTEPVNGTAADKAIEWVRTHCPATRPVDPAVEWFRGPQTWRTGVDAGRLDGLFGWGSRIDATYLNDRTTIILGDSPTTAGGAMWVPDAQRAGRFRLVPDPAFDTPGDGTVPDSMARIEGVSRVFKAKGADHMTLPATWSVIMAVRDALANRSPRLAPFTLGASQAGPGALPELGTPVTPAEFFGTTPTPARRERVVVASAAIGAAAAPPLAPPVPETLPIADVSPPPSRRLKVYSFDPLFGTHLVNLGAAQLTVELPWEFADGSRLLPGPIGEYFEVVDFDASSHCFYPPVDLNHAHLLAQDGIPVSEGDPRFHQQMTYAVAMATVRQFEVALGRTALWAPNLPRDEYGEVPHSADSLPEAVYVGKLRVYPHAVRERNAYYSPAKKALLFGYFPADAADAGDNLPGGMVFACLSYDIVAHETTHALLDGLHRDLIQPSNPDVHAFHEAFADVVALFQHFSHPEVLRHQIAKSCGDVEGDNSLGELAAQFGQATGHRRALRSYLGRTDKDGKPFRPERAALAGVTEPHDRGPSSWRRCSARSSTSTTSASRTCGASRPGGRGSCRPATCTRTWWTGSPARPRPRPGTCCGCASAPSTTSPPWTSPSGSTSARSSRPTTTWSGTTTATTAWRSSPPSATGASSPAASCRCPWTACFGTPPRPRRRTRTGGRGR